MLTEKTGVVRTAKPVDCPSEAVVNGNIGCFGSRRVWENSQRRYKCLCT